MLEKAKIHRAFWVVPVLFVLSFMRTSQAEAWERDHHRHNRHHHHRHVHYDHPSVHWHGKNFSITLGGGHYHPHRYYHRHYPQYVVVHEPVSVIIPSIPRGCRLVRVNGREYYTNNDVYYIKVAGGYQTVDRPTTVVVDSDAVAYQDAGSGGSNGNFTVNIPNTKGGYTAVTLKRSGSGFSGPQGEYYSEFPSVEQLRAMYGK